MPDVRAIVVSDLHLQPRATLARIEEPDWWRAMARPLLEIEKLALTHDVPVLYAGDIFDRWNAPPEVINFAIRALPAGYAIPGQHDLPHHRYKDIRRTAYWTLVEAGKLENVPPGKCMWVGDGDRGFMLHGFPWGHEITPIDPTPGDLHIAIVHKYVWQRGAGYPGAPDGGLVKTRKSRHAGYNVVAYGDNHKGFIVPGRGGGPWVINCGGMMRRKGDEIDSTPGCGLVLSDGTVTRHYFDTSEDVIARTTSDEDRVSRVIDITDFADSLSDLGGSDALDFRAAVKRFFNSNEISQETRGVITEAIDNAEDK